MFNILREINIKNIKNVIFNIFKRMPFSALISWFAFTLLVVLIRIKDIDKMLQNNLYKILATLILSFFFSIAIYFFCESKQFISVKKWLYQLITLGFAWLFYYFFEENLFSSIQAETIVYVILTLLGVLAFLFVSFNMRNFSTRVSSQENFYVAVYSLAIKSIMAIIVGVVSMILGAIAFSAIFSLFDIKNITEEDWYGYWMSFSALLFAPMYFLANLPNFSEKNQFEINEVANKKFFSFLINYVGLPAIVIYFLILYAYTVKVLINFSEWPRGEVTWMVILFSFFGYLIYFASFVFVSKFRPAKIFRNILPIAVILQTLMLFYAIGLRIKQYDITMNRYLVVVFGLWLFGLSLYYIVSRKKDLRMFFSSLLVAVILMSFGPWSVYLMPERRQLARLETNLKEANILQADGSIVPLDKYGDISVELSCDIYGGIEYLCNYHGCKMLEPFFAKEISEIKRNDKVEWERSHALQIADAKKNNLADSKWIKELEEKKYIETASYTIIEKLAQKLRVEKFSIDNNLSVESEYLRFSNENQNSLNDSLEISGYDYYVKLSSELNDFGNQTSESDGQGKKESLPVYSVVLDANAKELRLYFGENVAERYDIETSILKPILTNEKKYINPNQFDAKNVILLSNENMTFFLTGVKFDLKVVIGTISIKNPKFAPSAPDQTDNTNHAPVDVYEARDVSGYVLVKRK